jgi:hypothetical protein
MAASSNPAANAPGGPINIGGNVITDKNVDVGNGATGTFATNSGNVVTVMNGIIVNIS